MIGTLIAISAVAGGAAFGWRRKIISAADRRRVRRELAAVPAADETTRDGVTVRVRGIVRALGEPMTAPLTGRLCVAHRSRIFRGAAGTCETATVRPFVIERQGEAPIVVDCEHALFDLPPVHLPRSNAEREERFLALHGVRGASARSPRFEEVVIEPGDEISVAGFMMLDAASSPSPAERSFRDADPSTMRLTGNRQQPIVVGAFGT